MSIIMIVIFKIENFTGRVIPEKAKAESRLYGPIENIAPNILPFLKAEKAKILENRPKNTII